MYIISSVRYPKLPGDRFCGDVAFETKTTFLQVHFPPHNETLLLLLRLDSCHVLRSPMDKTLPLGIIYLFNSQYYIDGISASLTLVHIIYVESIEIFGIGYTNLLIIFWWVVRTQFARSPELLSSLVDPFVAHCKLTHTQTHEYSIK